MGRKKKGGRNAPWLTMSGRWLASLEERPQRVGLVRLLPAELRLVAAEVAGGRPLPVDGPAQVQVLDDSLGRQREDLAHGLGDLRLLDARGALRIDHDG